MKTTIIQLSELDSVASIKEKISNSLTQRVLLVWPDEGVINLNQLDYLIILRFAYNLDIQLSCVLDDPVVIRLMKDYGISTFRSIPESEKKPWRKPRIIKHIDKENSADKKDFLNDYREISTRPKTHMPDYLQWLFFIFGILSFFSLIIFLIPGAVVTIQPESETRSMSIPIRAAPTVNQMNITGAIPAKTLNVVIKGELEESSTGIIRIPEEFSKGEVLFRNLSDKKITIPVGTVVRTEAEPIIRFETTEPASLPPRFNAEVLVDVRSTIGGPEGNIIAGRITTIEDDFGANLAVTNPLTIDGGVDIKTLSPTEKDYDLAKTILLEDLANAANDKFKQVYGEDYFIPAESIVFEEILWEDRIPDVGNPGERFRLKLEVRYSAWALSNEDLVYLSNMVLNSEIEEEFEPISGSTIFQVDDKTIKFLEDELNFGIIASHDVYQTINEPQLLEKIIGQSTTNAKNIIKREIKLMSDPVIMVFPSFWDYLPFLRFRIDVVVNGH